MKHVAWTSEIALRVNGGATWTRPDGNEVVVCEVATVPDDFDPNKKVEPDKGFHDEDDFGSKLPCSRWPDIKYVGEVLKCVKGNPNYGFDSLDWGDDLFEEDFNAAREA